MIHRLSKPHRGNLGFRSEGAGDPGQDFEMRFCQWSAVLFLGTAWAAVGQESSAQRLEAAQRDTEEASWPRKPDNRLSPLSGKMKEVNTVSPRLYGSGREFPATKLDTLQQESRLGRRPGWVAPEGAGWDQVRWQGASDTADGKKMNERFQAGAAWEGTRRFTAEELPRKPAPDWASRPSPREVGSDGSLRRYEGRLTRVRQQFLQEDAAKARDLGPGRQERFRPEEVEKMLSEPNALADAALREQPRAASLPAAAGN